MVARTNERRGIQKDDRVLIFPGEMQKGAEIIAAIPGRKVRYQSRSSLSIILPRSTLKAALRIGTVLTRYRNFFYVYTKTFSQS